MMESPAFVQKCQQFIWDLTQNIKHSKLIKQGNVTFNINTTSSFRRECPVCLLDVGASVCVTQMPGAFTDANDVQKCSAQCPNYRSLFPIQCTISCTLYRKQGTSVQGTISNTASDTMKRAKRSAVWSHFKLVNDDKCTICGSILTNVLVSRFG